MANLIGTAADESLSGTAQSDSIDGLGGCDSLSGGRDDDVVIGGGDCDFLYGGQGSDVLIGDDASGQEFRTVTAATAMPAHDDWMEGGAGADRMFGSLGNDTLLGGRDDDTLNGGSGSDSFWFQAREGRDVITDFEDGVDALIFDGIPRASTVWRAIGNATERAGNVIFNFGGGHAVVVKDMALADLADDILIL